MRRGLIISVMFFLAVLSFRNPPVDAAAPKRAAAAHAAMQDEALPAVEAHRVKAPKVDIASLRDPFESYLSVIEQQNRKRQEILRVHESRRVRQPLEKFDLNTLKLVAIMKMGDSYAAMVEDSEGKGYVVRTGAYIGRDNGKVVAIDARNVHILEKIVSPTGEIVHRKVNLTLNEVSE